MSMLRSAAMTLLSKTLLTFLYKYLSDVDVEGVEMPSLYSSDEKSGWGVRLSNVRLREGAELMALPGGKQKPPRRGQTTKKKKKLTDKQDGCPEQSTMDQSHRRSESHQKTGGNEDVENSIHSIRVGDDDRSTARLQSTDDDIHGMSFSACDDHVRRTLSSSEMEEQTDTALTEGSDSDSSDVSIPVPDPSPRPETPVQHSSLSFLHCFGPKDGTPANNHASIKQQAASKRAAANGLKLVDQREQGACLPSQTPSKEERDDEGHYYNQQLKEVSAVVMDSNGILRNNAASLPTIPTPETEEAYYNEQDDHSQHRGHQTERKYVSEHGPRRQRHHTERKNASEHGLQERGLGCSKDPGHYDLSDEEEDEDDEEDMEKESSMPMALRIGKGGYIGTIDVRLVSRELHVLVEDAFINLEAVTKPVDPDDDKAEANDGNPAETKPKLAEGAEKKPAINFADLKTTGERVLAQNPLARLISSLPHLFLRDIRIRLVVRGDTPAEGTAGEEEPSSNDSVDDEQSVLENADAIIDVGIEMLSVSEGEDFMSPFNVEESSMHGTDEESAKSIAARKHPPTGDSVSSPKNEYLYRRIRTGKGIDSGLWVNVLTPRLERNRFYKRSANPTIDETLHREHHRWARHEWLETTRHCVFRCSGLDVQARIFLGTKQELAASSFLWTGDDEYEAYQGIEHTLYGFDHVVPGPTPDTLPPLDSVRNSLRRSKDEGDDNGNLRSQIYTLDRNNIQSSKISSCFYRVARGLTPTRCTVEHLPCENCTYCWEKTGESPIVDDRDSALDSSSPMPGLALSISLRDPLELNVDRLSLGALGMVIGLFKKKEVPTAEEEENDEKSAAPPKAEQSKVENGAAEVEEVTESRGFSSYFFGSSKKNPSKRGVIAGLLQSRRKLEPAFPTYMKPEAIQMVGLNVAKILLRVHVMREDDADRHNFGYSFCYWDSVTECITLDQQKLHCDDKFFQDIRFDAALFQVTEHRGASSSVLLSLGVPYPPHLDLDFGNQSYPTLVDHSERPPWPNTACALLDVPAPVESLAYETRERHGIQLRFMRVDDPAIAVRKSRSLINIQLGTTDVNTPWDVRHTIRDIQNETMKCLFGTLPADAELPVEVDNVDRLTAYRAQLGGGTINLFPTLDVRLPLTRFAGDISSESGFSISTLLDRVEMSYGPAVHKRTPRASKVVSIKRLTSLPEPVRLRILLFVSDLGPLEEALRVKRECNSFLRCHAINKALNKLPLRQAKAGGKRVPRKNVAEADSIKLSRRQDLLNNLLTLDDDTLDRLWTSHQKKVKKAKKPAHHKT